jgi:queuine/archaeosine tRNA-ribosyltransferase
MRGIREAIAAGTFEAFVRDFYAMRDNGQTAID